MGGFISYRFLLEEDGMFFTLTKTVIPPNGKQFWHYTHHLEACFCIQGHGQLTNTNTGDVHDIIPDTMYALDKNDPHEFEAFDEVVLICVFNPPLKGGEVHREDGSYESYPGNYPKGEIK
jgi:L-ectoine synthase